MAHHVAEISSVENEAEVASKVTMALSMLDSRYKENIAHYAEEVHRCSHESDIAEIELEMLRKQKEPHENALSLAEKEVEYALRLLTRLTEQWIQKRVILSELESELGLMNLSNQQNSIVKSREAELKRVQLEIEDLELTLLHYELEKQNIILKIEPIARKMYLLEQKIRELDSKKRYIESSYLHRMTQLTPAQSLALPAIEEVSDTSMVS